ncbi:hypothetical protein SKAU_G00081840 [Synaphobranchus kaupii]|uniref:Uncharacterized protein n=1 Tax=Synaphobranchus kaupii TaxID=118154 RepID=A0A9Q1FUZ1_SYNKA|nr:hypothetical protein SKAU_G00081840 [Synaphobranchus kaupii]
MCSSDSHYEGEEEGPPAVRSSAAGGPVLSSASRPQGTFVPFLGQEYDYVEPRPSPGPAGLVSTSAAVNSGHISGALGLVSGFTALWGIGEPAKTGSACCGRRRPVAPSPPWESPPPPRTEVPRRKDGSAVISTPPICQNPPHISVFVSGCVWDVWGYQGAGVPALLPEAGEKRHSRSLNHRSSEW